MICLEEIKIVTLSDYLLIKSVCFNCRKQLVPLNKEIIKKGFKVMVFYDYDEFIRKLIYRYKAQGDIALASIFLIKHHKYLLKYQDCIFIYPPSNQDENEKRGFIHIKEILDQAKVRNEEVFEKVKEYKQTKSKDREQIKQVIRLKDIDKISQRKVVIFDDIITTGATIKACYELISHYCEVKAIICLAAKLKIEENVE